MGIYKVGFLFLPDWSYLQKFPIETTRLFVFYFFALFFLFALNEKSCISLASNILNIVAHVKESISYLVEFVFPALEAEDSSILKDTASHIVGEGICKFPVKLNTNMKNLRS